MAMEQFLCKGCEIEIPNFCVAVEGAQGFYCLPCAYTRLKEGLQRADSMVARLVTRRLAEIERAFIKSEKGGSCNKCSLQSRCLTRDL